MFRHLKFLYIQFDITRYPSQDQILHFLKSYATAFDKLKGSKPGTTSVDDLWREYNIYKIIPHFWCIFWALLMINSELENNFDYLRFANIRYNEYKRQKQLLLLYQLNQSN